jgi:outer membrane protein TolC
LRLAGVQNPQLNLARRRITESEAIRTLAAAQILPSLQPGGNYDNHTGVLQQSNGNILSLNRASIYVGAGANAVAAGTVNVPGVVLQGNIAEGIFAFLESRQLVRQREFASIAVRNQVFLQVAQGYSELIRAEARLAVANQNRGESREIARLTAEYAQTGEGRKADADRAATQLAMREANYQQAEGEVLTASARLAEVLNVDPSIRLHASDGWAVPLPIVPNQQPLAELVALGLLNRPELGERRAAIRESLLALEGARVLPFSPTVLIGFSGGGFGGGSNLVRPVFGGFGSRSDLDVVSYWTIRNLGVGNIALINLADARLQMSRFQELEVLNMVRAQVAEAYALSHARFAQIGTTEMAVRTGKNAYEEDFARIKLRAERRNLPIELLNSFQLLARSRNEYIDAIVDYNNAQFALYVAMGQPPADALAHPVPTNGVAPTPPRMDFSPSPAPPSPPPASTGPGPFTAPPSASLPVNRPVPPPTTARVDGPTAASTRPGMPGEPRSRVEE